MDAGGSNLTQNGDLLPGIGLTALLVADARASESERPDRLFDDPLARHFVTAATAASPTVERALRDDAPSEAVRQARHDSVAVRTRFFDDYLLAAAEAGCQQIVLVAAGLDARSFRLQWPAGTRLWELDSPEVLAFKEQVIGRLSAVPGCERFILPLDLREDWSRALTYARFDPGETTAWLIEGLLMYLDEANRDSLLGRVSRLSNPDSQLGLDHRSGFFSVPRASDPSDPQGTDAAAHFEALAAPASSDPSLTQPGEWLRSHGWAATFPDLAEPFARYGRSVPALLRTGHAATPPPWMGTAVRVERADRG